LTTLRMTLEKTACWFKHFFDDSSTMQRISLEKIAEYEAALISR